MRNDVAQQKIDARFLRNEAAKAVKAYFAPVRLIWKWASGGRLPMLISFAGCMVAGSALVAVSDGGLPPTLAKNEDVIEDFSLHLKSNDTLGIPARLTGLQSAAAVAHALDGLQASQAAPIKVKIIDDRIGAIKGISETAAQNRQMIFDILQSLQRTENSVADGQQLSGSLSDLKIREVQLVSSAVDPGSPAALDKMEVSRKLRSVLEQAQIVQGATFRVVASPETSKKEAAIWDSGAANGVVAIDQHDRSSDIPIEIKTIMISSAAPEYRKTVAGRGMTERYRR